MAEDIVDVIRSQRQGQFRPALLTAAVVVIIVLAACLFQFVRSQLQTAGPDGPRSSAAPPLVVCGTTMSTAEAGPNLFDLNSALDRASISESVDSLYYLQFVDGCDIGATFSINPVPAARIIKTAHTTDGKTKAISLQPLATSITISWTGPSGHGTIVIKLNPGDIQSLRVSK